jgi:predicted metal-binding membrane protein
MATRPTVPSDPGPVTLRDPATIATCLVLVVLALVAWVGVVRSAMSAMEHAGMAMSPMGLSLAEGVGFVAEWTVMMTSMMLPSALPMIALYGATRRKSGQAAPPGVPAAVFTLVYLVVWGLTGVPVYFASVALGHLPPTALAYGVAAVLIAAGIHQVSPLKQVCLRACRSPLGFLLGHWRAGRIGALRLGWAHALYCVGCCWALMLVLVAAGAMGLPWVLLIAAAVAAEKLLPGGDGVAPLIGVLLLALGVMAAFSPGLVTMLRGGHMM